MKKFYLLMMFALLGMVANAAEVTINFAEIYGASTISDISNESKTKDGFTFTFAKGNAQNPPAYNKAKEIRLYGGKSSTVIDGNTMTVSTEAGRVITKIVLTAGSLATWGELTSNIGSVTEDSSNIHQKKIALIAGAIFFVFISSLYYFVSFLFHSFNLSGVGLLLT